MNVYGTEQIRNVVLLGHGGAGKTTVAEAMALITGVTKRMGKVAEMCIRDRLPYGMVGEIQTEDINPRS